MMWKSPALSSLAGRLTRAGMARAESLNHCYSSMAPSHIPTRSTAKTAPTVEDQCGHQATLLNSDKNAGVMKKHQIGKNVSRKDRIDFLLKTLLNLKDSKEAVYGALDAWVAWEQDFPLVSLRRALIALEKEQQWHRVIQVIKWMLSKGQGKTMGTYGQLIQALDKDHRAEEAHVFWQKRIGLDLHSVPWQLCNLMIGVYYRNNMLEHLVKLGQQLCSGLTIRYLEFGLQSFSSAWKLLTVNLQKDQPCREWQMLMRCWACLKRGNV
uniref:Pentatricopeptide repeat-containing protein At4g18975ic-like n=1 Tax=Rhizophora mucronata TaxID=61149 RepID=A0A2P2K0B4_RHIMU